ncbi:SdrD B-like domain-containing protein, partial [Ruania rhizosphaerae]|uniref:SdrD B-like domain-containing protein n=1 Tax=Ruania rhizosphaerae TaxID=1840413 RepID=UPI00190F9A31
MLTSVVFENDGSMVLGFRDRTPDMLVQNGFSPDPDNRTSITGVIVGGDINKVCLTDGVYEWEGTGSCADNSTPANSGGEPVDRVEYFPGDFFDASIRYPGSTVMHLENSMGGLALNPREPDVANTTMDATGLFNTGGIGFYDREVGTGPGSEPLDRGLLIAGNETYNFAKGSGLGDLSLLAAEAPSQIGNRVWFDADEDGQQDPIDEPAVAGATVRLLSADGETVLAETVTDENGEYYFGGEGGYPLEPGGEYIVEFDVSTVDTSTLPGAPSVDDLQFTLTQAEGVPDELDSNPTRTDDPLVARASVVAPGVGEVDHTIDAGIYGADLVSVGDYVWIDEDRDGVQDEGETPVEGVTVTLLDENEDVVGTTVTDEDGYYVFTDLPISTDYTIEFPTTVVVDGQDYPLTQTGAGVDEGVDSNPDQGTGQFSFT